jgi:hypothetical protein
MVTTTTMHFPFFKLPPELRLNIYEIIAESTTIKLRKYKSTLPEGWPALCSSNQQIRGEFLPVLYQKAYFEAKVKDMDFSRIIGLSRNASTACRAALLKNERLIQYIDEYSGRPEAYAGLMDWVREHRKAYCSRVDWPPWKSLVLEAACKRGHSWETGEWFLDQCGFDRLREMTEESDTYIEKYLFEYLRLVMWRFAHPEENDVEHTNYDGCRVPKLVLEDAALDNFAPYTRRY